MTLCSVITETIFIADPHAGQRSGSISDVLGRHRLLAVHGKSRVDPAEQGAKELLREPLGTVQALAHAAAENLFHEPRSERPGPTGAQRPSSRNRRRKLSEETRPRRSTPIAERQRVTAVNDVNGKTTRKRSEELQPQPHGSCGLQRIGLGTPGVMMVKTGGGMILKSHTASILCNPAGLSRIESTDRHLNGRFTPCGFLWGLCCSAW